MAKVFGLGGIFFKSSDEATLWDWYARVLGLEFADWGGVAFKPDAAMAKPGAATVFCPFKADTDHFAPSDKNYMFNLMVDDLDGVLARCRAEGVEAGKILEFNGRFAHITLIKQFFALMMAEGNEPLFWKQSSALDHG